MMKNGIINGLWLLAACMPFAQALGVESHTKAVPADSGATVIYSSANSTPVWRLNVGISNSHCEHDVGSQSPDDAT